MTEKELTKKIIKDAEKQAAALVAAAQAQAQAKIAAAEQAALAEQTAAQQQAQAAWQQRQEQQQRAQAVDVVKAQINAKQALIDQVFQQVLTNLLQADLATKQQIVQRLKQKYAGPHDTIQIAAQWAAVDPTLPTTTAITSGIIITNPTYRWELSVEQILAELREQITLPVAQILGVIA